MPFLSTYAAADLLDCAPVTVGRAARRLGLGMRLPSGRLLSIDTSDLDRIRSVIRPGVGNPVWIDAAKCPPKQKPRKSRPVRGRKK